MRSQSGTYTIARNNPKVVYIPFKGGVYKPVQISSTRLFNHWYIYHSENTFIQWYIYHCQNQSKGGLYTTFRLSLAVVYVPLYELIMLRTEWNIDQ